MKLLHSGTLCATFFLGLIPHILADSSASDGNGKKAKEPVVKPCTIRSPSSGLFFDLNTIGIPRPKESDTKKKGDERTESWHAKGYDYGANFTLNFCAPVIEDLGSVEGVDKGLWQNVSAFYTEGKRTYSIGQQNSELVFRGSKLVLNYTNGSPCDSSDPDRRRGSFGFEHDTNDISAYDSKPLRRKSTIISLLCQKDVLPTSPKVSVAFVGASEDHCTYFFEARSTAACAGIETTPSQLSPGGVFGVILMIAIMAYLVGGCVYQRTVMHQRGWRQLPNYSMWAGIWGFFSDIFVILTSSCARFMPGRRGYSRLSLNGNGNIRGRHSDDENRLIDQLDEEWED